MVAEEQSTDGAFGYHCGRAAHLALYPDALFDEDEDVCTQHTEAVAQSNVGRLLKGLSSCSNPNGVSGDYLMALAVRFFAANGMRERFPRRMKNGQLQSQTDYLRSLRLWVSPSLGPTTGLGGPNSLDKVDKTALQEVAAEFFNTDCRCIWFERMLVDSIVAAEAYSFSEELRSNPYLATGKQSFVWLMLVSTAYQSSKGASPRYEVYLWLASLLYFVVKVAVAIAVGLYSAYLFDTDRAVGGFLSGAVAAIMGVNIVGQFVVGKIVRWAKAASGDALGFASGYKLDRLAQAARAVHAQIAHENMNPLLVRELLTRCVAHGLVVNPIVFGFLDRAIASGEYRWPA